MNFADVVVAAAPEVLDESAVVADRARVALGRTGIKGAKQGKSKSGFLQKRGPLKVSHSPWHSLLSLS
jgi:hypothetical protein